MQMPRLSHRTIPSLLALVLAMLWNADCAIAQQKPDKPLYERLGRYDAIAAVVDDFVGSRRS